MSSGLLWPPSSAVLPLNEATVEALCEAVRELDVFMEHDPGVCGDCDQAFAERVAIAETLFELAPSKSEGDAP